MHSLFLCSVLLCIKIFGKFAAVPRSAAFRALWNWHDSCLCCETRHAMMGSMPTHGKTGPRRACNTRMKPQQRAAYDRWCKRLELRSAPTCREALLYIAVFLDAVRQIVCRPGSRAGREAIAWVRGPAIDETLTFEAVCLILNLDAALVRKELLSDVVAATADTR